LAFFNEMASRSNDRFFNRRARRRAPGRFATMNIDVGNGIQLTEFRRTDQDALIDVRLYGLIGQQESRETTLPGGLIIRSYLDRDEEQVVQLWNDVFPDNLPNNDPAADIRKKLNVQRNLFLVGVLSDGVVATVVAGFDGHRGWLHRVAVAPHCRRRGFGQAMITAAEKRLVEIGCTKINLQVHATNQAAVEFYKSHDYNPEDRISMGKRIGER